MVSQGLAVQWVDQEVQHSNPRESPLHQYTTDSASASTCDNALRISLTISARKVLYRYSSGRSGCCCGILAVVFKLLFLCAIIIYKYKIHLSLSKCTECCTRIMIAFFAKLKHTAIVSQPGLRLLQLCYNKWRIARIRILDRRHSLTFHRLSVHPARIRSVLFVIR